MAAQVMLPSMGSTTSRGEPKRPRTELTERFRANLKAAIAADREIPSQSELSRVLRGRGLRMPQSSISRVLAGQQSPTLDAVHRLAHGLGFEPWQMLVPGFDPGNPPLTREDDEKLKALYSRLRQAQEELARYFVVPKR